MEELRGLHGVRGLKDEAAGGIWNRQCVCMPTTSTFMRCSGVSFFVQWRRLKAYAKGKGIKHHWLRADLCCGRQCGMFGRNPKQFYLDVNL